MPKDHSDCPKCKSSLTHSERLCPTCSYDLGAPNVRECSAAAERSALTQRLAEAKDRVEKSSCLSECLALESHVTSDSGVVIAVPAGVARNLAIDPKNIFVNYEMLVGAGVRTPASHSDDKTRRGIAGWLFGTVGEELRYGVLSLTDNGLPTYGDVFCRLRDVAVADRTSFMETNSFDFYETHKLGTAQTEIPAGYRAVWDNRHELTVAKLADNLRPGDSANEWQALLVQTDGKNRSDDDFIESHVYGPFNIHAVERMVAAKKLTKHAELDAKIAIEQFKKIGAKN